MKRPVTITNFVRGVRGKILSMALFSAARGERKYNLSCVSRKIHYKDRRPVSTFEVMDAPFGNKK
jgi:hypothetical protein